MATLTQRRKAPPRRAQDSAITETKSTAVTTSTDADVSDLKSSSTDFDAKSKLKLDSSLSLAGRPVWVVLAIASGACAAVNGVFAKLTTTSLTSSFSAYLSALLGLSADNNYVNVILRGSFFGLNLLFNGIMWGLFTAALAKGNSTTRVSIVNVSANFFITAILGWLIFSEKLPLQWWMGAALLACGNVVIGRREENETSGEPASLDQVAVDAVQAEGPLRRGVQPAVEDLIVLDEDQDGSTRSSRESARQLRRGQDIDAPL